MYLIKNISSDKSFQFSVYGTLAACRLFWKQILNREMMRLTTQMQAEFETIHGRIECIKKEVLTSVIEDFERFGGVSFQTGTKNEIFYEELNTYKVRMENILCETDDKEQDQLHDNSVPTEGSFCDC